MHSVPGALRHASRGIAAALRRRPSLFVGVAAAVVALDILVPPVVLSLARKPLDFFTFNPWLPKLPAYLVSDAPLGVRIEKTWRLALFWFSSDSPYGVEWGFAVTVADLARFLVMGLLIGAYWCLWAARRDGPDAWRGRVSAQGGTLGAAVSILGLGTGGCTVMGCGAPMLPVIGLAFSGLSSTTIWWLSGVSTVATAVVLVTMAVGVLYLGWRVGDTAARPISDIGAVESARGIAAATAAPQTAPRLH